MREIKYRVWDFKRKKMIIFDKIGFCDEYNCITFDCDWDKYDFGYGDLNLEDIDKDKIEVMEFTGLKDKNGNDIYEGDILRCYDERDEKICDFQIFYDNAFAGFCLKNTHQTLNFMVSCDAKIIGNIHENPELLKEEK